ncbi:LysR substrate-binding domain-containing protein [Bradyrhizobium ivorense]|uniref:LysR substrate-binding domain-containing protein n=1 Tax=Bradyrhizobium ivorense TaxID=2511166 RepID=UPI0010B045D5|nr:LysR substrate-binding domain-containing protein [Bradyrhizobium ivorense]VIO68414.1 HTH-type transcriptional regulator CynR [Bradyrhizobium ivorense]
MSLNPRSLNPRHVDLFREVVRHNGITKAALSLRIGQPFVSRAIARLEREIGFALFERGRGGVTLTVEGEIFLQEVERNQVGLDYLARAARGIRERGSGTLRIACLPAFTYSLMPRIVSSFSRKNPGIMLSVAVHSPERVWSLVASGQCDVGLARPQAGFTAVDDELLMTTDAVCVLPRQHRLRAKRSIAPRDLHGETMIAPAPGAPHRLRLERALENANVEVRTVAEIQYSMQRCALVAQGLGFSIVDPVVARDFASARIVLKPFTPRLEITTVLLFPSQRPRSRLALQFCELLRAETAEYRKTARATA